MSESHDELQIEQVTARDDTSVMTVYVEPDRVRIVAELSRLAWLPSYANSKENLDGWRGDLKRLFAPTVGYYDVEVQIHPAGLAIILGGSHAVQYWTDHARRIVVEYAKPLVWSGPTVAPAAA